MFQVGQLVALKVDPVRMGPVTAILPPIDGLIRYRVFHAPGTSREYAEDQLIAVPDQVEQGEVLTAQQFLARLTAARLHHPLTDHVYALRSARIRFVPFQFRPLLRLVRAEEPRLLIADDVGVGKTIEAGLILKELAARQPLDNVLVLCPKALTTKWREEMRRFDEDFRILEAGSLRYCLNETHLEGRWPREYRRSIVHYELLRLDPYLHGVPGPRGHRGLFELDPPPHFDLVIADEAHHLRTPASNGHQMATYLSQISTAMVLLSATPIQTSSTDLFTLLQLLRPDLFPEPPALAEMLVPNRHLTAAARTLRQEPDDNSANVALAALEQAAGTGWGAKTIAVDPRYRAVIHMLRSKVLTRDDRVTCVSEIEELNTLSPLVNRTRRRDIGPFTIREPYTVAVDFTAAQRTLYQRLIRTRRDELLSRYDPTVTALIMVTLERQAASCLPALAAQLAASQTLTASDLSDAPEAELDQVPDGAAQMSIDPQLRELARTLPAEDPKFEQLLRLVHDAQAAPGPGKILLFSYFLRTLDYLAERLAAAGVRVATVTGRIEEVERQRLRDRFRADRADPDALDVLLSSEVGCEGLDYEFCDRLVNYDIPWNPMRVEQRIGRIDRFGQPSPKVLVFNFVTPGTIEERVFHRCWERLGLFRDTLGDLEGVLGDIVQNLNDLVTSTELTSDQIDERARQLADNAVRLADATRNIQEISPDLLGLDESVTRDISALVAEGRAVTEEQLEQLLRTFLNESQLTGRLERERGDVLTLRLSKAARAWLATTLDARPELADSRPAHQLRKWLTGGEHGLSVTFSVDAATADRSLAFLTPTHPLIRMAASALAPVGDKPVSAHLRVVDSAIPEGTYLFAIDTWETIAVRPEHRAVAFVVDLATSQPVPAVEQRLLQLLATAESGPPPAGARDIDGAQEALDAYADQRRRAAVAAAGDLNDVLVARRLTSLQAHHERISQRLAEHLMTATEPRIARMRAAQQVRADEDYQRRRQALEGRRSADIVGHRIAEGVLTITHVQ